MGVKRPYRDCKCSFEDLKNTNPTCVYITLDDIQQDNVRKQNDDDSGKQYFKSVSRYDIKNAFLQRFMPLSDNVHGPFIVMPPKLLHTPGSGLIMYMFESLCHHLGGGIDQDYIDQEHIVVSNIIQRQSEHDFPRGLMRNGLIDDTKIQSSEQNKPIGPAALLYYVLCTTIRRIQIPLHEEVLCTIRRIQIPLREEVGFDGYIKSSASRCGQRAAET